MRGVYCPNCGSKVEIVDNTGTCPDKRCGADIKTEWVDENTLRVAYEKDTFELPPKS